MTLSLWLSDMGEWYMTRTASVRGVLLKICAACAAAHHKRTGRRQGKQQVARRRRGLHMCFWFCFWGFCLFWYLQFFHVVRHYIAAF